MSRRHYRLLCPIARALDRIGDRWTLLILRDLHAGPARFSDLQAALPGLAPNLLTTRLRQLEEDALIRRRETELSVSVYELTATGARTGGLLYELAAFGSQFPPDEDVRRPGNLRLVAVTLKVACQRVVDPTMSLRAELVMDGEKFELLVAKGEVDIQYRAATDPQVVVSIDYEASIAVADGQLSMEEFGANHVEVLAGEPVLVEGLMNLLSAATAHMAA
jgi:DNA-binding HxlR family transcriptional regulator